MDPSQSQDGRPRNRKAVASVPSPTPSLEEDDKVKGIVSRFSSLSVSRSSPPDSGWLISLCFFAATTFTDW